MFVMRLPVIEKALPRKKTPQFSVFAMVLPARTTRASARLLAVNPAPPQSWIRSPEKLTSVEPSPKTLSCTQLEVAAVTSRSSKRRYRFDLR